MRGIVILMMLVLSYQAKATSFLFLDHRFVYCENREEGDGSFSTVIQQSVSTFTRANRWAQGYCENIWVHSRVRGISCTGQGFDLTIEKETLEGTLTLLFADNGPKTYKVQCVGQEFAHR